MNDNEELPAYWSELEEGEIREFKSLVKNPHTIPLPNSPSDSPSDSPCVPATPNPTPELIPQPAPILENFEIEPISFCGCGRRRSSKRGSWLDFLYALL